MLISRNNDKVSKSNDQLDRLVREWISAASKLRGRSHIVSTIVASHILVL